MRLPTATGQARQTNGRKAEARPGPRLPAKGRLPAGRADARDVHARCNIGLADELPVMIAFVDRQLHYRFLNKSGPPTRFERPRSEILGRGRCLETGEEAFARHGGAWPASASPLTRPGCLRPAVCGGAGRSVPWRDAAGEVQGFIALMTDVTEQRPAEQALREVPHTGFGAGDDVIASSTGTTISSTTPMPVRESRERARAFDWRTIIHPDDAKRLIEESQTEKRRSSRSRSRPATAATTGNIARCAACRRRAQRRRQPRPAHRGGQRYHPGQGSRARVEEPGRGAEPQADPERSPVPRDLGDGARSMVLLRARRAPLLNCKEGCVALRRSRQAIGIRKPGTRRRSRPMQARAVDIEASRRSGEGRDVQRGSRDGARRRAHRVH